MMAGSLKEREEGKGRIEHKTGTDQLHKEKGGEASV